MIIFDDIALRIYETLSLDKIISFLNPYIYIITAVSLVIYIYYLIKLDRITKFEQYLVEALNNLGEYLDQGYSLEAALTYIGQDKTNPTAKYFSRIVENLNAGQSYEDAINNVMKTVSSDSFNYIGEVIIATLKSNADVTKSLKEFSTQLQSILHFNRIIETKSAMPILVIKLLGCLLLPILFFFSTAIFSIGEFALTITPAQIAFLFLTMLLLNFEDYFMFMDLKSSLASLPFALSLFLVVILKLGPLVLRMMT